MSEECFICGMGNSAVLEEHHIVPQRYDGSDRECNLVTLCRNCHGAIEEIYSEEVWSRIGLTTVWDPDNSPLVRTRWWKSRTLENQLQTWIEHKESYLERACSYEHLQLAEPEEVDSKYHAYELGRLQAMYALLRELRHDSDKITPEL